MSFVRYFASSLVRFDSYLKELYSNIEMARNYQRTDLDRSLFPFDTTVCSLQSFRSVRAYSSFDFMDSDDVDERKPASRKEASMPRFFDTMIAIFMVLQRSCMLPVSHDLDGPPIQIALPGCNSIGALRIHGSILSTLVEIASIEPDPPVRRALKKRKNQRNRLTNHDYFQGKWDDPCNALKSFDFQSVERGEFSLIQKCNQCGNTMWLPPEVQLLCTGICMLPVSYDLDGPHIQIALPGYNSIGALRTYGSTLSTLVEIASIEPDPPVQRALKNKNKKRRNRRNIYNITVKDSAQVAVGENARIVNYYTNDKQDEKDVCSTAGGMLTKFLRVYYRTGERALLFPLPWMEGDQFHVYTSTKIVEMNTNHVTSLEKIFLKAATDYPTNIRRILIEGKPGIGKSAICKKIAYDWSRNENPNFKVVLSLKCRDFHTGSNLWDAIEKQNFSDCLKKKKNEIFEYIESNQSDVLLILDGYDEIPDKSADTMKQSIERLMGGQLLPHCYLIVTSRPGKSSEIRKHFDRKLEIKGFELNDSFKFIRHFFVSEPEDADSLIQLIERFEDLKDLVRSPLYAAILCVVHQERKDDYSPSLGTLYNEIVFCLIKRYCKEKLRKEIRDDEIMTEFQDVIFLLGKKAFNMIKENQVGINDKEFTVFFSGTASHRSLDIGFLVYIKSLNKIRPENTYNFTDGSIEKHLAKCYVKRSITSINCREMYSIFMTFKDFESFLRSLKFLYTLLKFETRIVSQKFFELSEVLLTYRFIRFVIHCFLYSIYIAMKIITCFIRVVINVFIRVSAF